MNLKKKRKKKKKTPALVGIQLGQSKMGLQWQITLGITLLAILETAQALT